MQARDSRRERDDAVTSLIFPAYNPGPRLEQTWWEVRRFLRSAGDPWEVVFVCDGCTDGTPERLARLVAEEADRVRVVSYRPNRGKGFAVRRGLATARGAWRIFADVDLAYGFDDIERLARALRAGADVAIASRMHPDSRLVMPPRLQGYVYRRHLQSQLFSLLTRTLLPLSQRDTQAGLKGLSSRAAGLVVPHLRCNGFEFDCELLTACVRQGLGIVEVPVCVRYEDASSTTRLRGAGGLLRALWRIRRTWRFPRAVPVEPGQPERRGAA